MHNTMVSASSPFTAAYKVWASAAEVEQMLQSLSTQQETKCHEHANCCTLSPSHSELLLLFVQKCKELNR